MAAHDIIVIGASAGGVETLHTLVRDLPADLGAAVFIVLHVAPAAPSVLPSILCRGSTLPVRHAADGERIEPGTVYVAPPDRHLLVHQGRIALVAGVRENGFRPAIDPLFRSAARACGARVIGVVLTGTLDDGTVGLQTIKDHGGLAVVQDPEDAMFPGMPRNAIERVAVDHVVPLASMAALLVELVGREPATDQLDESQEANAMPRDELELDRDVVEINAGVRHNEALGGDVSAYTCPECHGTLWEHRNGEAVRFRCRVGHAYTEETLLAEQGSSLEAAIWTALTALEEHAAFTWRMAERVGARGHAQRRATYADKARLLEQRAQVIRDLLNRTNFAVASASDGT